MVKVKFNSYIQYKIIDDCETGLSVDSDQQQESDSQEEESDGEYPNQDIENMSSNTESLRIDIDGLDQIEDSYADFSDEEQNYTNGEQSSNKYKIIAEENDTWIWIILSFCIVCTTTRLARSKGLTCILQETGVNYRENIQNSIEFSLLNL